jgi:plastocyanin
MKTLVPAVVLLCVAVAPAGGRTRDPGRVQVVAKEFRLLPSRYVLQAGPTIVELVNAGEDPHDLALRRLVPGGRTIRMHVVQPGQVARMSVDLRKGRYDVWCTVANHRSLGMRARLVVR